MKTLRSFICFLFVNICLFTINAQSLFVSSVATPGSTYLRVDDDDLLQLFLNDEISERQLLLETNVSFSLKSSADWCKAFVQDGQVFLNLEENLDPEKRSAVVLLSAKDNLSREISVIQTGTNPCVLVKQTSVELADGQLDFEIEALSNVAIDFIVPDWITILDGTYQKGVKKYLFKAEPLSGDTSIRTGDIVINSLDGSMQEVVVSVKQVFEGYPRFAVISDIHFGSGDALEKVPTALKNLLSKEPVDALFICGDLSNYGQYSHYTDLLSVFRDEKIIPQDLPVYYLMGNHDHYGGDASYENYYRLGQPLDQYVVIKGYPFITISMTGIYSDDYSDERIAFLADKLGQAATDFPGKPIFVFTHVPPAGTVYGSNGWGTHRFDDVLEKYPQVVIFSGHSHFPLGDPRSIYQGKFTAINDGSTTYSEVESGIVSEGIHPAGYDQVTEGVIVNVDADMNIEVERWNTADNEEILPRWTIKAPHDGSQFVYANRTGGEHPQFKSDAVVRVDNILDESCEVSFVQATDDEVVHRYRVELIHADAVVATNTVFSGFYLNSKMPESLTVGFTGIPTGVTLYARVTAIDSYGNESEPIRSDEFMAEEYVPEEGTTKPEADIFDIVFEKEGVAKDISVQQVTVVPGLTIPTTYYNETYNMWAASFNGNGNCHYKIPYNDNDLIKNAFENGFTFEVLYKPNDTGNMCPLSGQESGGAGIEQSSNGNIQFFPYIGGGYQTVTGLVQVEAGRYYHVVASYDKEASCVRLYVNGMLAGEQVVSGSFAFPSNESAHWIGIGGDAHTSETAQFALDGDVLLARMYAKAVSRDEVYWMYKDVEDKKNNGYQPTPGSSKPQADLFDVVFNDDGSAVDISERNVEVLTGSTLPIVCMNDSFGRNEAAFPGKSDCFYRIDYADDEAIKKAFYEGFSFEVLYSPDEIKNVCPMSAQESGGAGIEQASDGVIQLYIRLGNGYKVVKSDVKAVAGNYYHVIATYDKAEGVIKLYVNGLLAGTMSVSEDFGYPEDIKAQWIAIGGDANGSGKAQYSLLGKVVVARMYGFALNRDDVYWLYDEVASDLDGHE